MDVSCIVWSWDSSQHLRQQWLHRRSLQRGKLLPPGVTLLLLTAAWAEREGERELLAVQFPYVTHRSFPCLGTEVAPWFQWHCSALDSDSCVQPLLLLPLKSTDHALMQGRSLSRAGVSTDIKGRAAVLFHKTCEDGPGSCLPFSYGDNQCSCHLNVTLIPRWVLLIA